MSESLTTKDMLDDFHLKMNALLLKCRIMTDIKTTNEKGEMNKKGPFFVDTKVVPVMFYQEAILKNSIDPVRVLREIAGLSGWGEPLYREINYFVLKGFLCSVSLRGKEVVADWRGWRPDLAKIMAAASFLNYLGFVVNVDFYTNVFPGWSHVGKMDKYLEGVFETRNDPHQLISRRVFMPEKGQTNNNKGTSKHLQWMDSLFQKLTKSSVTNEEVDTRCGSHPREVTSVDCAVTSLVKPENYEAQPSSTEKRKSESLKPRIRIEIKSGRLHLYRSNNAEETHESVTQNKASLDKKNDASEALMEKERCDMECVNSSNEYDSMLIQLPKRLKVDRTATVVSSTTMDFCDLTEDNETDKDESALTIRNEIADQWKRKSGRPVPRICKQIKSGRLELYRCNDNDETEKSVKQNIGSLEEKRDYINSSSECDSGPVNMRKETTPSCNTTIQPKYTESTIMSFVVDHVDEESNKALQTLKDSLVNTKQDKQVVQPVKIREKQNKYRVAIPDGDREIIDYQQKVCNESYSNDKVEKEIKNFIFVDNDQRIKRHVNAYKNKAMNFIIRHEQNLINIDIDLGML